MWSSFLQSISPSSAKSERQSQVVSVLQTSEFLLQLRKFKDLWKLAFDGHHHIAVPSNESIDFKMTREQMEAHILSDSKFMGEYRTLSNQVVELRGNEFLLTRGFESEQAIPILSTERIDITESLEKDPFMELMNTIVNPRKQQEQHSA